MHLACQSKWYLRYLPNQRIGAITHLAMPNLGQRLSLSVQKDSGKQIPAVSEGLGIQHVAGRPVWRAKCI